MENINTIKHASYKHLRDQLLSNIVFLRGLWFEHNKSDYTKELSLSVL